jgi:hypothetical protein
VTTEFAHVSVPVPPDIMIQQADGTGRIGGARMVQHVIELRSAAGITWQVEEQQVQPHTIQTPPPGLAQTNKGG